MQWPSRTVIIFGLLGFALQCSAENGLVRVGMDGGFGEADVQVSGSDRTESPYTFAFLIDYQLTSTLVLGVEHYRSLVDDDGPSSGVGFTGVFGKFFFGSMRTQNLPKNDVISQDEIIVKGYFPYVGVSAGVGQASLRALDATTGGDRSLSVGGYVGGKIGVEYPLQRDFTLFAEASFAMTVMGTGTIYFPRAAVGVMYEL